MKHENLGKLSLPCLKGKMGDWFYYVTLLKFSEVASRVSLPEEIDKKYKNQESLKLGDWIQRKIQPQRTQAIVEYLNSQPQRFFNSLILGIYGGKPSWQEINVTSNSEKYEENSLFFKNVEYFSNTFGILNLEGTEDIFAIDGQHRAIGIREAVLSNSTLLDDEITIIFVAHKIDEEGKIRTRRLFSTLNKYAKPVNQSEIIALSEDNNCAIITRKFIELYEPLYGKILVNKNRSIHPENTTAFSNILTVYDSIEKILTDKKVYSLKVVGKSLSKYTINREGDKILDADYSTVQRYYDAIFSKIPSLKKFVEGESINRKGKQGSLLFRPIGQNILFDVLKVAESNGVFDKAIAYFAKDDFTLTNNVWENVFWNSKNQTIIPDKSRQRYATLLILEKLNCNIKRTTKDQETYDNFGFTTKEI